MGFIQDRINAKSVKILQQELGLDIEIYCQEPCEFRTSRGEPDWRKGFVAASIQGLHVWRPKGGLFSQDWGTIRYLNTHPSDYMSALSTVAFNGDITQVYSRQRLETINVSFAAWSSLLPSAVSAGGAEMDFVPGRLEMPAVMGIQGQWSGGAVQVRQHVSRWAEAIDRNLESSLDLNLLNSDIPNGQSAEGVWNWWDIRARQVIQSELSLTNRAMKDVDVVSTKGAILNSDMSKLCDIWLAIVNSRELWTIYFPVIAELFRPSLGLHRINLPIPGSNASLSKKACDLMPGAITRYDLSHLQDSISTSIYNDGRGPLTIRTPRTGKGVISSTIELDPIMIYGIDGEYGWDVFRAVLSTSVSSVTE